MKRAKLVAIAAAVLTIAGAWAVEAQEAGATGTQVTIQVPVKHYKILASADVYQAALNNFQADVRFRDAFAGRTVIADAVARVVVGGVEYVPAVAFRTAAGLVCLVPYSSPDALRTLFGLPQDWPVTPAVLGGRMVLNPGQQITVEGTVIGTAVGEKHVMVDSVMLTATERTPTHRELQILGPGATQPKIISEPGTTTLSFPCTHGPGKTADVKITVEALRPAELRDALARKTALLEGLRAGVKTYGEYSAGVAYRYATQGEPVNVDYTDQAGRTFGSDPPPALRTVPTVRGGMPVSVPVGFAFNTLNGVTCLVPADRPTLMGRAATVLPGEAVRIRGTSLGLLGGYASILADYIGFPAQEAAAADGESWLVTVEWQGAPPKVLWDDGLYVMPDLPCQDKPGQFETLQVSVGQFRSVKVELPPVPVVKPPAPAPATAPKASGAAAPAPGTPKPAPTPAAPAGAAATK